MEDDDEARQLKQALRETGSRRKHHTSAATSHSSTTSSSSSSRRSSHDSVYPVLSQPSTSRTAPSTSSASAASSSFTGGWKPASSPFAGAPIAQPVRAQPHRRELSAEADKEYVMVDDDDSPQSAELSQILRRQSLTQTTSRSPANDTIASPPPLGQRVSGDLRYAQQLQEQEDKQREELDRAEREDRKTAEQLAQQQEDDDRKFAEMLQRREEEEARFTGNSDDFGMQPQPRTTARPSSSATSWSGSIGPFGVSFSTGHGGGSQEVMMDPRARLLQQLQRLGMVHAQRSLYDHADDYEDDFHATGRFRPSASPFFDHHGFPGGGGMYGQPDIDNMSYEELLELSERMGQVKSKGLAEEQLSVLPTWRWKGAVKQESASSGVDEKDEKGRRQDGADSDDSCSICLTPYDEGEEIKRLPCMHIFHSECVDRWLLQNEKCPICNTPVSQSVGSGEDGEVVDGGGGSGGRRSRSSRNSRSGRGGPFDITEID